MYTCIYVYSYGHHLAAQVIGKRERHSLPMFELGYKSRRRASEVDKITFKFSFAVPCTIIALPCHSVSRLVEFCSNCCSCYMYFTKLLNGFFKIDTWISLSCYMDLSKLLHGFVKVVSWICQSCFIFFSPFAKQNQAEVWPRFQSLMKLLFWTIEVDWVKVLNALGPLCFWQCFICIRTFKLFPSCKGAAGDLLHQTVPNHSMWRICEDLLICG